jgi:dTMP kinase
MEGFLFVLSGIDGCGKTTATQNVVERLNDFSLGLESNLGYKEPKKAIATREAGGSDLGVREIILSKNLDPETETLLFLADRCHHVKNVLRPALNARNIVICDRYTESTSIYQGIAKGVDSYLIQMGNEYVTGGLKPRKTFYIQVSVETALERLKDKDKDRFENKDMISRVYTAYEIFAQKANWITIDGEQEPEKVCEDIVGHILDYVKI